MDLIILWHMPGDPASEAALDHLQARGATPHVRLIEKEPPSPEELAQVREALGCHAIELVRVEDRAFRDLDLADADDDALLAAMAAHPQLVARPLVIAGGHAARGEDAAAIDRLLEAVAPQVAARSSAG